MLTHLHGMSSAIKTEMSCDKDSAPHFCDSLHPVRDTPQEDRSKAARSLSAKRPFPRPAPFRRTGYSCVPRLYHYENKPYSRFMD